MPRRPPKVPSPLEKINVRWGVYRLRSKAGRIGSITGPDDPARALQTGIEQLEIRESDRVRVSERRE
jgi:hypothetical protein